MSGSWRASARPPGFNTGRSADAAAYGTIQAAMPAVSSDERVVAAFAGYSHAFPVWEEPYNERVITAHLPFSPPNRPLQPAALHLTWGWR